MWHHWEGASEEGMIIQTAHLVLASVVAVPAFLVYLRLVHRYTSGHLIAISKLFRVAFDRSDAPSQPWAHVHQTFVIATGDAMTP